MANNVAGVAMMAMMVASAGSPARAAAAESAAGSIVIHLIDYQRVPRAEMAEAEKHVARVYARAGVQVVWADGRARQASPDGFTHLDVVILNDEMTARKGPAAEAFGQASHETKVAYIYYSRIIRHARETSSDPARALALVIAHETGHVLLPEHSHAPSGLMRANWDERVVNVPLFMKMQAEAIRRIVTATN